MMLVRILRGFVFCAMTSVTLLFFAASAGAIPALKVSTLPDGAITNNQTLNVSGVAKDDDTGSGVTGVSVNGQSASLAVDGIFSHALTLSTGANNVTMVATDAAGNSVEDTRVVTLDLTAPKITISSPADNIATSQSPVTVTGTVDKNVLVEILVNGSSQAAMSGPSFTADVILAQGLNTITITARDQAANKCSAAKRTIVYDTAKPTLQIQDPPQDFVTNQSSYTIRGIISDTQSAVTVAVDGVTSTPPVDNGAFEKLANFSENKSYQITATASDASGKDTAVTRNIIYDNASPAMKAASPTAATGSDGVGRSKKVAFATSAIVLPEITARSTTAGGYYKAGDKINVTLDFSEPVTTNGLTILLNSGATITSGPLAGAISYSGMYSVADGENVDILNVSSVSGTLTDSTGNQYPNPYVPDGSNIGNVYKIIVDTAPPTATISSHPADPTKIKTGSFSFTINEKDASSECRIDSGAYSSCSSPRNVDLSTLADTRHTFFVRGIDLAGNIGAPTSFSWTIDTTPPSVNAGGNKAANAIFTQTATVSDANPLGLTYQWTPQSGPGTITFGSLTSRVTTIKASADGTYLLRLTVTDAAGNSSFGQMTLEWDTTAPTVNAGGNKTAEAVFTQTATASSDATAVTYLWEKKSGPGNITFGSSTALVTTISASANGTYVLRLTATDAVGNSSFSEMTLIWKTVPPPLDVTSPAGDTRSTQESIVISGNTQPGVIVTITIDPDTTPLKDQVTFTPTVDKGNGSFSQAITLSGENIYTIAVKATDYAGSESIVKRRVILGIPNGNINGLGKVDVDDALLALQVSVGMKEQLDSYLVKGDVGPFKDGKPAPDWKIDISDVVLILRIIVGQISL